MYDIIIIGAGTAGLTAAIYARRASKKVLVFEAKTYGGQIINSLSIENYPCEPHISGFDFATKIYNQAKELGAEFVFEKVVNIDKDTDKMIINTANQTYFSKTIILATGSDNRKLNLDKEDKFLGKGISYCATCDGAFYRDKSVAIVGGGYVAVEDALYLADIAKKVYLIHRRDKLAVDDSKIDLLEQKENIILLYNSNITRLIGDEKLENIEIKNSDEHKEILEIDGLFIAVGRIPENQNFSKLVDLDSKGYIIAGEDCKTNEPSIFVAGDNRTKIVRQLVTAASDGAVAATAAIKYLSNLKDV